MPPKELYTQTIECVTELEVGQTIRILRDDEDFCHDFLGTVSIIHCDPRDWDNHVVVKAGFVALYHGSCVRVIPPLLLEVWKANV